MVSISKFGTLNGLLLLCVTFAFVTENGGRQTKSRVRGVYAPWGTASLASTALKENGSENDQRSKTVVRRRPPVFTSGANARGGGSEGGGGAFKLGKPMKLQRIVSQSPAQSFEELTAEAAPRSRQDPAGGGEGRSTTSRAPRKFSRGDGDDKPGNTGAAAAAGGPTKDAARRRDGKPIKRGGRSDDDNSKKNPGKNSLRVGSSGRKGRSAELTQRRGTLKRRDRASEKEARAEAAIERKTVYLPDGPMTVGELSNLIDEKPVAIIKMLMSDLGVMASMTQSLDPATCIAVVQGFNKIVADLDEYGYEGDGDGSALDTGVVVDDDEDGDALVLRPPVVTIMGHVDHGKTSLLDAIRNTDVTAGEAGGITQAISSYQVKHNGQKITFIDTPGHAAFTDMRERGANITDIVILVVAADDSVKQQTVDSIMCARQAGVPLVVAINKCDLETADPTKVMTDLTSYDILTEEFGGDVMVSRISAKKSDNLDDLLDKVMLQAEIQNLRVNPDRAAECFVIEANVQKGLGTVATSLVKRGTLRVGDIFVAGETYGRVRALISTTDGKTRMKEAGPSTPVNIVGFEGIPAAGDLLVVCGDEQVVREMAESRQRISRERSSSTYQAGLMDSVAMAFGPGKNRREMYVLVKADVQGSAEALTRALSELKLENDEAVVGIKVLVSEAGEISKSDIAIASVTPGTIVIAFNCPASFAAMEDARVAGINIEYYNIIYDAIESVEKRMQEVLSPTPDGEYVGSAIVQEVFNIGGTGNIGGSRCTFGVLRKGGNVRVLRGDKILAESKIVSLRNFKAEVDSIEEGDECGIGLLDFEDFEADDVIECFIVKK